jgi:hypothetical protein
MVHVDFTSCNTRFPIDANASACEAIGMRAALLALLPACYVNNPPPPQYGAPAPQPPPQSTHQGVCTVGNDGQEYCGAGHAGYPQGYPPGYVGDGYPSGTPERNGEVCMTGSDGMTVCGWDCKAGTTGRVSCAAMPGGQCAQGSDGHVYCTPTPAR